VEINGTIFIQILIFLSLLLLLSRNLFRPILKVFDERDRRILGAKEEASSMEESAQQKSQQFKREVAIAKQKARQVLVEIKAEAAESKRNIIESARGAAREEVMAATKILKAEEQVARDQLQGQVGTLADEIVKNLMPKSV
jgi:F-type H+-transporting ATPase subunit b